MVWKYLTSIDYLAHRLFCGGLVGGVSLGIQTSNRVKYRGYSPADSMALIYGGILAGSILGAAAASYPPVSVPFAIVCVYLEKD